MLKYAPTPFIPSSEGACRPPPSGPLLCNWTGASFGEAEGLPFPPPIPDLRSGNGEQHPPSFPTFFPSLSFFLPKKERGGQLLSESSVWIVLSPSLASLPVPIIINRRFMMMGKGRAGGVFDLGKQRERGSSAGQGQ
jgi:hypothetical protein